MSSSAANRLRHASSPYLLQHAHNPVDWYPWSDEAWLRARREDKPIFLSVGYASCHWCHVMAHESFEDEDTASLMNDLFINIKVDREERPDVDEIYMQAVQLFSGGHGGWPMSVFLTPGLEPFFAGTYFPKDPRHGMPNFKTVLRSVADAYAQRRDDVSQTANQVVTALQQMAVVPPAEAKPGPEIFDRAFQALESVYDTTHGGFGGAPKFPHSMDIAFLLRYGRRHANEKATSMALHSLRQMARGGIYDHLGGGFHRYATDARWLVPHFEKMLYDNALLARTCIEAHQVSGEEDFHRLCTEILEYVGREMRRPEGGFCSAQDADSEGVEGKFFVWTAEEIDAICGKELGSLARTLYGVTQEGNFEGGTNVLSLPRLPQDVASERGLDPDRVVAALSEARKRLFEARSRRIAPDLDDKVLAAWNGLMIRAYAQAFQVWRQPQHLERARQAAVFILGESRDGLFRTWRAGRTSGPAFLDDYACMIAALLDLYEATFEPRWLHKAQEWNDRVLDEFWDDDAGSFFFSGKHHESLLTRGRQYLDQATPSGNAVQVANLLRLAMLSGEERWRERAQRVFLSLGKVLGQYTTAMGEMLCSLDLDLGPACEVALVGKGETFEALCRATFAGFVPNKVVAGWPHSGEPADLALLQARRPPQGSTAAAFVCRNHTCQAPVESPVALQQALAEASRA
jgi:uncharacterized protein YyaL (SSP411 family)